jgi:hypothetical protein
MVLDNLKVAYIVCNAFIYLGWLTLVLAFSILKQQKNDKAVVVHTVEVFINVEASLQQFTGHICYYPVYARCFFFRLVRV